MDVDDRRAAPREERRREDLHVAGEHDQVDACRRAARAARAPLPAWSSVVTGTWSNGDAEARRLGARSAWLETTSGMSACSSPRRQRHSSSSRQWSSRDTRIATRLRRAA